MKKLFIILVLLIAGFAGFSQVGNDTTKYIYFKPVYGNRLDRYWANKVLDLPNDTTYSKYGLARKGTLLYVGNGVYWTVTGGGGGGGTYTADETTLHLSGVNVFSIKSTYTGQSSIINVGNLQSGQLVSGFTPVADALISSSGTWNAKQTSVLTNGKIWIGNGSNAATEQTLSGDISISNTGAATLPTSGVSAGSYTNANITVDAKGRITTASNGSGGGFSTPFADNTDIIKNAADATKLIRFSAAGITTATTRTLTSPDASGTIDLANNVATLSNKTIAAGSNTITGLVNANLSGTAGITNANLANSTISGVALGSNLLSHTAGYGLSGSTFNGSAAQSWVTDTSVIASKTWVNSLTTTFNLRTPGSIAGAQVTAFTNAGALVIPKWGTGYGVILTAQADSAIEIKADTASSFSLASKAYVNARVFTVDGTTITNTGGVISSVGSGGGVPATMNTVPNSANYTATTAGMFILANLTGATNRTFTWPSAVQKAFYIIKNNNQAASGFTWSHTGRSVYNSSNTVETTFNPETVYFVVDDGVNLNITAKYSTTSGGGYGPTDTVTTLATQYDLKLAFVKDTTIAATVSTATTYTNSALIGTQINGLYIQGARIPMHAVTGQISAAFNGTTGTFTLTNGTFTSGDAVDINYVIGNANSIGGGGGGMGGTGSGLSDSVRVTTISSNATLSSVYGHVRINATSGNVTATLPAASSAFSSVSGNGKIFYVIRTDLSANTATVAAAGSDTINGSASVAITSQWVGHLFVATSSTTWDQIY